MRRMLAALVLGACTETPPGDDPRADPRDGARTALGARVYAQHCASCHGSKLEGQPDWRQRLPNGRMPAPPHDESGHTWHHPDHVLFGITKLGHEALDRTDPAGARDGDAGKRARPARV
jgi:hypothetical protein